MCHLKNYEWALPLPVSRQLGLSSVGVWSWGLLPHSDLGAMLCLKAERVSVDV